MLRVTDVFRSIQGEGSDIGRDVVFVRFGGCNRRCVWCDTPDSLSQYAGKDMWISEVVEEIEKQGWIRWIVLTGGEPLIQEEEELAELVSILQDAGHRVAVETNGTVATTIPFDLVTVSPKLSSSGLSYASLAALSSLLHYHTPKLVLKFAVGTSQDAEEAKYILDAVGMHYVFLQPVDIGNKETRPLTEFAEFIRQVWGKDFYQKMEVRFLPQLHKLVGIK